MSIIHTQQFNKHLKVVYRKTMQEMMNDTTTKYAKISSGIFKQRHMTKKKIIDG